MRVLAISCIVSSEEPFYKASKHRDFKVFVRLFEKLKAQAIQKLDRPEKLILFPVDSTVITLTSKLLWQKKYHQVKLFAGTSNEREIIDGVHIHFGQGHDSQYGNKTIEATAENSICRMDRGFASSERVKELLQQKNKYFVLRIKNDATLKMRLFRP
ncbi:Transposase [Geitlerinema sp. FC II]|nr:Transposase [Geitlerinema sp. FC II]